MIIQVLFSVDDLIMDRPYSQLVCEFASLHAAFRGSVAANALLETALKGSLLARCHPVKPLIRPVGNLFPRGVAL